MKLQDIALVLAIVAVAAGQFVLKERRAMDEQRAVAAEPDFALLHRQASDALAALRLSHERRLASAVDPAR